MIKLPKQQVQTMALFGLFGALGFYVYVQYLFAPMSRDAKSVEQQVRGLRERLRSLEAATANEAALQAQYRQVEQVVGALRTAMPDEGELPSVIELVSALAEKSDVKIQTVFPQRTVAVSESSTGREAPVYKEVPIQIDALAGFHELGTFLSLVEMGEKPMQVMSLRISANPKEPRRHQVNLLVRAYFAVAGS
ncbi:MAG: type 4a pilus biogenesis protein PilO [Candidatus Omnitrophica bacterium]|nr:type 4a pilus biogenesis protein PilO [Candidatus Omnitrophota bacterium]